MPCLDTKYSPSEMKTQFVEEGTALANISKLLSASSRNVFYPASGRHDFVFVDDLHEELSISLGTTTVARSSSDGHFVDDVTYGRGGVRSTELGDVVVTTRPVLRTTQHLTVPLAIWEGTVETVDSIAGVMHATLVCKTGVMGDHAVEIPLKEVEPADEDLLSEGAVFYLEQYQRNLRGGRETIQVLRFRRSAVWNNRALQWAKDRATALDKSLPGSFSLEVD